MKLTMPLSFRFILTGFLFLLIPSILFFSCTPAQKAAGPFSTMYRISTNFYELSLSKTQYEALKTYHGGASKKMVVQFYFHSVAINSPSLIAYASKTKNDFEKTGMTLSRILTITPNIGIAVPDEFVLGDQQVNFKKIDDDLITASGISAAQDYELIFKPVMKGKNVCYEICLKYGAVLYCGGDSGVPTNPSPPKDAD